MSKHLRDTDADYKAALEEEYEAYVRAGRTDEAEHVAATLKADHGHEVDVKAKKRTAKRASAPERADQKAPEEAVPPKPVRSED